MDDREQCSPRMEQALEVYEMGRGKGMTSLPPGIFITKGGEDVAFVRVGGKSEMEDAFISSCVLARVVEAEEVVVAVSGGALPEGVEGDLAQVLTLPVVLVMHYPVEGEITTEGMAVRQDDKGRFSYHPIDTRRIDQDPTYSTLAEAARLIWASPLLEKDLQLPFALRVQIAALALFDGMDGVDLAFAPGFPGEET